MWNACYSVILEHYADFEGRARRSEFWWFYLAYMVVSIALLILGEFHLVFEIAWWAFVVLLFLPGLAVSVRRLHDSGRSGWWILINLIPFVGWIVFLVFMLLPSDDEANRYGRSPNEEETIQRIAQRAGREAVDETLAQLHEQDGHPGRSGPDCHDCLEVVEQIRALRRGGG